MNLERQRDVPTRLRRELQDSAEYMHAGDAAFSRSAFAEMILIFLTAALLAVSINVFVFQIIRVDGISMQPTFFTDERVFAEKLFYRFSPPKRKDVVICRYQLNPEFFPDEKSERVIKRVIALPGERVAVRNGAIYVNDEALDESGYWNGSIDFDMEEITVPENHYFVVGDNRNHSWDSRDPDVGPVPYENILGHVLFVIWPFNSFGRFAT